jgi:hypothetical protein
MTYRLAAGMVACMAVSCRGPNPVSCRSSADCSDGNVCVSREDYPSTSAGRTPPAQYCRRPWNTDWAKGQPCRRTSDCTLDYACYAEMTYECPQSGASCRAGLVGRCIPDLGNHKLCRSHSECVPNGRCGAGLLLDCPAAGGDCQISTIGELGWHGHTWRGTESICVQDRQKL